MRRDVAATRAAAEVAALPGVVAVVPNDDKAALVTRLLDVSGPTTAQRFGDGDGACGEMIGPGAAGRTGYTLRVQTGCDETCAYCVIPSTRGRGRSVPLVRVLAEADRAVAAGYQEIVLTGVHIGSYGRDLEPRRTLFDLLRALEAHPSSVLFRLSSLEPMDCTPAIVELVTTSNRIARTFTCRSRTRATRCCARCGGPITLADYRRVVTDIRARLPHAGIGSDLHCQLSGRDRS